MMRYFSRAVLTTASALAMASPVWAQEQRVEDEVSVYDTIVVTAQKREENVLDVPVSVTVVGADQLNDQKIFSIADLSRTTPSLEMIQAFGGPGGGGQVRGVGTQSFTRSAEGAVGIVVDGVPQGNVPNTAIFDLSRVEVLKGPQGTLFGLTASAGVINMATVAPQLGAYEGYVHVDYSPVDNLGSEFGQRLYRGAVNLPLGETAALRVAGNFDTVEGIQYNAASGEESQSESFSARARLLWELSDKVTLNLIGDFTKIDRNYADPGFAYVSSEEILSLDEELAACGITISYDNNATCGVLPEYSATKNQGASAQFDIALGEGTLTSITGYRHNENGPDSFDIMGNSVQFLQIYNTNLINEGTQFTQEIRYASPSGDKLEYVAGGFYSKFEGSGGYSDGGGFYVGTFQLAPFFIPFHAENMTSETTNESYALFGQATYHVSDNLSFLGGLRFTSQELTDRQSANLYEPSEPVAGSTDESNVSGKIGVQYVAPNDTHLYATYTRGYKGPQVVPAAQGNPVTVIDAEIPTAYEIGAKGAFFRGQLGYDVNVFYTDVENYQGQRCAINSVGALACVGESIPSVTTQGFEVSAFGSPVDNLDINVGYIYNKAEYPSGWTGFNPYDLRDPVAGTDIGVSDMSGLQIVGVPEHKFIANAQYVVPVGAVNFMMGGDAVYKSDVRLGPSSDPRFVYPSDWTISARIGIEDPDGAWSVELFGRNLTENREPATLFGGPAFIPPDTVPFAPNGMIDGVSGWTTKASLRQVGISAEFRF